MKRPVREPDQIWPLDLAIAALAGLVLYLIVAQLRFNDPRWLYNGWTYIIAVPLIAFLLAIVSRLVASKYVHRSLQLGFLFSVFVHLLLLVLAINVVIFRNFFPDALTGIKQERSPIRRTIPEYVFLAPNETSPTPDWSQPVDAETASPVVPTEKRQIPPVDHTAAKLEVPRPIDPERRSVRKFLLKRDQPSESIPQPANSPGRRARPRWTDDSKSVPWRPENPNAPDQKADSSPRPTMVERSLDSRSASRPSTPSTSVASTVSRDLPRDLDLPNDRDPPAAPAQSFSPTTARSDRQAMPEISSSQRRSRQPQSIKQNLPTAGALPSAPRISISRKDRLADRMRETVETFPAAKSETSGANLAMQTGTDSDLATAENRSVAASTPDRRLEQHRSDLPVIVAGDIRQHDRQTSRRTRSTREVALAGSPPRSTGKVATAAERPVGNQQISDRIAESDSSRRPDRSSSGPPNLPEAHQTGPSLDLLLDEGPVGMASKISPNAGIVPGQSVPDIASLELSPSLQRRRNLGGPVTPFGTKIAAVESFSRRMKRTNGGAAPTPAGAVGPATEEAIERGLAFLADIQNDDGSWSLQGHGSDVALHSDSAATGLCLLAFQGAGYTHRRHQYADTVSRGLKFIVENQKTNGDLYRVEDQISNENVALYSHGIASLALCEAYGMTQDPKLEKPAQDCLRYIIETQNRRRGGWRYTPQVSSDTSVTGWMMMALKSGQLAGLDVPEKTYRGIGRWLDQAQVSRDQKDRYRYNPFAPDTPSQRHGRTPTPTMTAVGMLMRMYMGWHREHPSMQSAANYLMKHPPQMGSRRSPQRDGYYWYYATMVMFHMGGDHWKEWNRYLKPVLLKSQVTEGESAGSWDPILPVPDRWSPHAGRIYVTTMNLLNLEVYYRHLPIYGESSE